MCCYVGLSKQSLFIYMILLCIHNNDISSNGSDLQQLNTCIHSTQILDVKSLCMTVHVHLLYANCLDLKLTQNFVTHCCNFVAYIVCIIMQLYIMFVLQTIMIQNLYRNPNNNSSNPYGPSEFTFIIMLYVCRCQTHTHTHTCACVQMLTLSVHYPIHTLAFVHHSCNCVQLIYCSTIAKLLDSAMYHIATHIQHTHTNSTYTCTRVHVLVFILVVCM